MKISNGVLFQHFFIIQVYIVKSILFHYLGTFCESEINYCASFPCMNGGSCSNNVLPSLSFDVAVNEITTNGSSLINPVDKKFVCKCLPEFEGLQCEVSKIIENVLRFLF